MCERFCTCQKDCTHANFLDDHAACIPHTEVEAAQDEQRRTSGKSELDEFDARSERSEEDRGNPTTSAVTLAASAALPIASTKTTTPGAGSPNTATTTDLTPAIPPPVRLEDTPASNATANGLLSEFYMWCGTAALTRTCADHPYEYQCDMDTGKLAFLVREYACHTNCRCLGECQWRDIVYDLNVQCASEDGPAGVQVGRTMAEIEARDGREPGGR
jgi:hypothetical protein